MRATLLTDVLRSSDGRTALTALEQVQENYRPAVELFYLADLSYKEIRIDRHMKLLFEPISSHWRPRNKDMSVRPLQQTV